MTGETTYEYLNFEVAIQKQDGDFWVSVTDSPANQSEGRDRLKLPFKEDISKLALKLEIAVLRGSGTFRSAGSSKHEKSLRDFGEAMHRAIFMQSPTVRDAYSASVALADERGTGLRLRFRIDPPELSALPWEYLYNAVDTKTERGYISLYSRTPLVRSLHLGRPSRNLTVQGPLRILGMIANPGARSLQGNWDGNDWEPLNTDLERRLIDEAIAPLERSGKVLFKWVPGESARHLLTMMRKEPWHVFHFIGHGGSSEDSEDQDEGAAGLPSEGFIVLSDEMGGATEVGASDLYTLLEGHRSLRLTILNCCYSARGTQSDSYASPGAALARAGIPAVLAMQYPISDRAAVILAREFYEALADYYPVDAALTHARKLMKAKSSIEWGVPVLYLRAPDGQLFSTGGGDPSTEEVAENGQARYVGQDSHREHDDVSDGASATGDDVVPRPFPFKIASRPTAEVAAVDSDPLLRFWFQLNAAPSQPATGESSQDDDGNLVEQLESRAGLLESQAEGGALDSESLEQLSYGQLDELIESKSKILELMPEDEETRLIISLAHHRRGVLRFAEDQAEAAASIQDFTKAITLNPARSEPNFERAKLYGRAGAYGLALADLDHAIELEPKMAEYWWTQGVVRSLSRIASGQRGDQKPAIASFNEAIKLRGEEAKYYNSRASAHKAMGCLDLALADLERAVDLAPGVQRYADLRDRIRREIG